jgi:hypothetical protein
VCSMASSTDSKTNVLHVCDTIASDTTRLPDAIEALMELRNRQHLSLSAFIHTSTPSNKTAPACRHRARSSSPIPELPSPMPIAARACRHMIAAGNGAKQNEQVATTDTDEADDDCGNDDQQCWKGAPVKGCSGRGQRIQRKAVQSAQDARLARALHEQWSDRALALKPRKRPRLSSVLSRQPISTSVSSVMPLVA